MTAEEREKAIEEISKALRQLVSVDPQLLFEATKKVGGEAIFDGFKASAEEANDKKLRAIARRAALCMAWSQELLSSGSAQLSAKDVAQAIHFASWMEGSDHAEQN